MSLVLSASSWSNDEPAPRRKSVFGGPPPASTAEPAAAGRESFLSSTPAAADGPAPPVKKVIEQMSAFEAGADTGAALADFRPPPIPEFTKMPAVDDGPIGPAMSKVAAANHLNLYTNYRKAYEPTNYYTPSAPAEKDRILEKLNYLIHLMEMTQVEKTDNVTEELVLYTFLGLFVIFVCDSMARYGARRA